MNISQVTRLACLAFALSLAAACGQPTSFKETETGIAPGEPDPNRDSTVITGATSESEDLKGTLDEGSDSACAGCAVDDPAADAGTPGDKIDDPADALSDDGDEPGQVDPNGNQPNDGDQPTQGEPDDDDSMTPPTKDPSEVLEEDGGTLVIPGSKAQKVGVNFEDYTDFDYNDSVLCFVGDFKVDGSNVVSYKEQTVKATVFSASGCDHRIDVSIINEDGSVRSFSYNSKGTPEVSLQFGIKSRLEVTMTPIAGSCTRVVSMHDPDYALVRRDVCNLTGT